MLLGHAAKSGDSNRGGKGPATLSGCLESAALAAVDAAAISSTPACQIAYISHILQLQAIVVRDARRRQEPD
jgi:hypothetical protein